jgi:hypothetical protein
MKLRSLFLALAGALLFTAALAPRASATLIVYFNFEDTPGTDGRNAVFDNFADCVPGTPGCATDSNTGGGIQFSTLTLTTTANVSTAGGVLDNRSAGDQDPAPPVPPSFRGHALLLNDTKNTTADLCFTVNTSLLTGLSLTFATDNNGNGYDTVELLYSTNGGVTFTSAGSQDLVTGVHVIAFNNIAPTVFTGNGSPPSTIFCLHFTGGASNGQDRQTVIDNIQLNATVVPEPATVAGGLLGLCGLCWHQRRRLVRSLRFRPA